MIASDAVVIIAAVGVVVVNIITALAVLRTGTKADEATAKAGEAKEAAKETHLAVNSRMEKFLADQKIETERLMKLAITSAHAEGVKQAMDIQKSVNEIKSQ